MISDRMKYGLGEEWHRVLYPRICKSLQFSESEDRLGRDILSHLLALKGIRPMDLLGSENSTEKEFASVILAGRTLARDLKFLGKDFLRNTYTIAADGAGNEFHRKFGVVPDAIVSDLDSCSFSLLSEVSSSRILFVHSHGDNIRQILSLVPMMGSKIFGTTQVEDDPRSRVFNVGGFMDGDRACYIATLLGFKKLLILGLYFPFSSKFIKKTTTERRNRATSRKERKLEWSKKSLQHLILKTRGKVDFFTPSQDAYGISGLKKIEVAQAPLGAS